MQSKIVQLTISYVLTLRIGDGEDSTAFQENF